MAWYPCCCGTATCSFCSGTAPNTITVTFSGWSAGTNCLDCSALDGTFVLTFVTQCMWVYEETVSCGAETMTFYIRADAQELTPPFYPWGWNVLARVTKSVYSNFAKYQWNSGAYSAFDCSTTRTAPRVDTSAGTPLVCTSPLNCQVN